MKYPGNCASPKETAKWAASVAKEYGLPGILPVACSCVELTSAWTSEGCLEDVPGYLNALDHDSYGLMQQRPSQGWGTYEQVTDADYAVRKFCSEAVKLKDEEWNENTADADTLGRWIQAVQRSAYPERYAQIGYPLAKSLLEGVEETVKYPQRNIGFDKDGWALDLETNIYLKSNRRDAMLYTNKDGWLWGKPVKEEKEWEWPEANEPVGYRGDGSYIDYHPTRYDNVWRIDIETLARKVVDAFSGKVWANTYYQHPPGWNRDATSVDFWDYSGRGNPIDPVIGQQVFDYIFNDPNPPWIEWCIWQGWIWTSSGGWSVFNDDGTGLHYDHCHFTFS